MTLIDEALVAFELHEREQRAKMSGKKATR
jgi:hypothetical protein